MKRLILPFALLITFASQAQQPEDFDYFEANRTLIRNGGPESGPVIHAAFRAGIGCVVLAPDQDFDDIDALLAVYAMKLALGDSWAYATFPRKALLDRFGLLYQQGGVWQGERLISEKWIEFERTPAPATAERGNMYGAVSTTANRDSTAGT